MKVFDVTNTPDAKTIGLEMYDLIVQLFPINRSITGNGLRQTLRILQEHIPLQVHEVPSGTKVFDWEIPKEWNIRDAYVKNPKGEKVIDFKRTNLHILNYSIPVKKTVSLKELREHLFTLPDHPDWIPYKTSYYRENWGFCLSHRQFLTLEDGKYEVFIDSALESGSLTYGELYLQGEEENEILISCHACHPSLANDNLSGVSLATFLASEINSGPHRYSYRFLFIPGTIGAITWLALNEEKTKNIKHGLVISGVGDSGKISYKRSRRGDSEMDRAVGHALKVSGEPYEIMDFHPYGYDERQYCSPGFDLPVGRISRTPYGKYREYHTSADNLQFVIPDSLADTFSKVWQIMQIIENSKYYVNKNPMCEPHLGKRGLYDQIGADQLAMLWVLNYSDNRHSLLDIAEKSGIAFRSIHKAAEVLRNADLLG